jgi:hypothetical protein
MLTREKVNMKKQLGRVVVSVALSSAFGMGCGAEPWPVTGDPTFGTAPQGLELATSRPAVTERVASQIARLDLASLLRSDRNLAPPEPRPPTEPGPAQSECVEGPRSASVETTATATDTGKAVSASRYPVDQISSLRLSAKVSGLCGAHVGHFDLYAPDGTFYTRLSGRFEIGTRVQGVRFEAGAPVLEMTLPVAGTDIASTAMLGTWSVNFLVDDEGLALGIGLFELYR